MAVVALVSTVKLTLIADTRTVTATAAIQDTAAGLSVSITAAQTTVGAAPPDEPDLVDVEFYMENDTTGAIINISFTTLQAQLPVTKNFFFTNTGATGGAARCGTVGINLRIRRTTSPGGTNDYDVDGYNIRSTKPASYTISQQDKGWIRATTTATDILSNISAGGGKTSPFAYPDQVWIRKTLGHTPYKSSTINLLLGTKTIGAIASATTVFNATLANAIDNLYPISSSSQSTSSTVGNSALSVLPFTVLTTNTTDSATVDPRLTVSVQAQKSTPRTNGGNVTAYVISADQLFVWCRTQNSRAAVIGSITMTQRLKSAGGAIVTTDTAQVTAAGDGWVTNPLDWTAFVIAPAGNRTQEAFPNAPSNAVGLGTGTQLIGLSSAYTEQRAIAIHIPDEIAQGAAQQIVTEYRELTTFPTTMTNVAPDNNDLRIDIFSVDGATGALTSEAGFPAALTRIAATNVYALTWAPANAGTFVIEVTGVVAGGGIIGSTAVTVRPQFDPVALATAGVLSSRM